MAALLPNYNTTTNRWLFPAGVLFDADTFLRIPRVEFYYVEGERIEFVLAGNVAAARSSPAVVYPFNPCLVRLSALFLAF